MILQNKNVGYGFFTRWDLMFSMSLSKEFQLLQVLIYPTFYATNLVWKDVKRSKFQRNSVYVDLWYVWSVRFWLPIPETKTSRETMHVLICFSIVSLVSRFLLFKSLKNLMSLVPFQKQPECHHHILNNIKAC